MITPRDPGSEIKIGQHQGGGTIFTARMMVPRGMAGAHIDADIRAAAPPPPSYPPAPQQSPASATQPAPPSIRRCGYTGVCLAQAQQGAQQGGLAPLAPPAQPPLPNGPPPPRSNPEAEALDDGRVGVRLRRQLEAIQLRKEARAAPATQLAAQPAVGPAAPLGGSIPQSAWGDYRQGVVLTARADTGAGRVRPHTRASEQSRWPRYLRAADGMSVGDSATSATRRAERQASGGSSGGQTPSARAAKSKGVRQGARQG